MERYPKGSDPVSIIRRAFSVAQDQERADLTQLLRRWEAVANILDHQGRPFKILGLNRDATSAQIRAARKVLSLHVHPDKNDLPRAGEAFRLLQVRRSL